MTSPLDRLKQDHRELLRDAGLDGQARREPTPEEHAEVMKRILADAKESDAVYGEGDSLDQYRADIEEFLKGPSKRLATEEPYAKVSGIIEATLHRFGYRLPGPVHVGEFPTHSFNAQACRTRHGTLLLINTGLKFLLVEVARAMTARTVTLREDRKGRFRKPRITTRMNERMASSDKELAQTLTWYLLQRDDVPHGRQPVDMGPRGLMAHAMADCAEFFAVAHEYGHFLAGHLERSERPGRDRGLLRKRQDQEFEADEIAAMLTLQSCTRLGLTEEEPGGGRLAKQLAVAGLFLFFGIDHLLDRVLNEVSGVRPEHLLSDHPASDDRAAAIRRTLSEQEDPEVFQLAEQFVQLLSGFETETVELVRHTWHRTQRPGG